MKATGTDSSKHVVSQRIVCHLERDFSHNSHNFSNHFAGEESLSIGWLDSFLSGIVKLWISMALYLNVSLLSGSWKMNQKIECWSLYLAVFLPNVDKMNKSVFCFIALLISLIDLLGLDGQTWLTSPSGTRFLPY